MNILVTGARAPIAADIAKALSLSGHNVWITDSLRVPLGAASPFIRGYLRLPPPRQLFRAFRAQLGAACARLAIDAVIPTSEEVFWLAGAARGLPATTNVRTSPLAVLAPLHHKGDFARLAVQLGCGAPQTIELASPADIARLGAARGFVLKPAYSRFASQTLIAPSARQLHRLSPTRASPWLAQTRVFGRELCSYNVAAAGRLLLHVAYEPLVRFGVGASVSFAPILHEGLREMSARFIAATGFTGQISFDVIETATGLVALECNPRGTSGVHLASQHPEILSAALLGTLRTPAPSLTIEPRQLLLPMLLQNPRPLFTRHLSKGQDALTAAGISPLRQMLALAEMAWQAARLRTGLAKASTADIEWNGETMDA